MAQNETTIPQVNINIADRFEDVEKVNFYRIYERACEQGILETMTYNTFRNTLEDKTNPTKQTLILVGVAMGLCEESFAKTQGISLKEARNMVISNLYNQNIGFRYEYTGEVIAYDITKYQITTEVKPK